MKYPIETRKQPIYITNFKDEDINQLEKFNLYFEKLLFSDLKKVKQTLIKNDNQRFFVFI